MSFNNLNQRTSQHNLHPGLHMAFGEKHRNRKQFSGRHMLKNTTIEEIENAMTHQTSISQNSIEMEHLTGTTIELKKRPFNYQCLPLSSLFLIANLGKQVRHTSPPCITAGFRNQNGDPHHNRSPKTHVAFRDHGAPPKNPPEFTNPPPPPAQNPTAEHQMGTNTKQGHGEPTSPLRRRRRLRKQEPRADGCEGARAQKTLAANQTKN